MKKKYTIHVVSNTHWDREWRYSYQRMRMDLVELMDRLLYICEHEPEFKYYHLDSQTILLEDYLEIRPEKRDLLSKHIRSGKLLVGPWYTLPDMFLVSAEATVRNLMRGHKIAAFLGGKAMKVGYTPNSYGQNSQIAQTYRGFDIDSIIFYRGMDVLGIKKSEYILEGPDGSRLLGIKLPNNFTRAFYRWKVFGSTIHRHGVPEPRTYFHPNDAESFTDGYSLLHADFYDVFETGGIAPGIESIKEEIADRATTEHLLALDGFDASYPHPNSGKSVVWANRQKLGDKLIHQSFPKYIETMKKSVDWSKLQVVKGERRTPSRDTGGTTIMQGVLTSHSYFKRANHDTQTLLEKYAEPMSSFAWMLGGEYIAGYMDQAWKLLLTNHGHDTICGASVDQIYSDAMDRLKQAQMIAHHTTLWGERDIVTKITKSDIKTKEAVVTVFNTLPFERTELVEMHVDFAQEDKVTEFAIEDFNGKQIPYQILSKRSDYGVAENGDIGYWAYYVDQVRIAFLADSIPALGYKSFRIVPKRAGALCGKGSLAKSPRTLENEFIKASINANGTVDVTDKATRKTYKGLNYFEDGGDAGDPWYYRRPKQDRIITTQKSKASIRLVEDEPLSAAYRVEVAMDVPEALSPDKITRLKIGGQIKFTSVLRLTSTSRYLEVSTHVETPVEDHRLRVCFPSGLRTDRSYAESNFDLVDRPIEYKEDSSKWIDPELGIQPQQAFVDLTDGKCGLAILNRGLRDYEISQDKSRTIAVTLLRGIRYPRIAGGAKPWLDDPAQVACQCKGGFDFNYAIYPHAGDWQRGNVFAEARRINVPMRTAQLDGNARMTAPECSFIQIEPESLVVSAVKVSESGKSLILRFFNPTGKKVNGRITLASEIRRARRVNLNEEPLPEGGVDLLDAHSLHMDVPRKKIVTLELFLKRPSAKLR